MPCFLIEIGVDKLANFSMMGRIDTAATRLGDFYFLSAPASLLKWLYPPQKGRSILKRHILVCAMAGLFSFSAMAAEQSKTPPPPAVQSTTSQAGNEQAAPLETKSIAVPKRKAKWSNARLDLTHCLNRETNTEIIKCAE